MLSAEEELERKTADTLRSISSDLDKLIELEIANLSPTEHARARAREKLTAAKRGRGRP